MQPSFLRRITTNKCDNRAETKGGGEGRGARIRRKEAGNKGGGDGGSEKVGRRREEVRDKGERDGWDEAGS